MAKSYGYYRRDSDALMWSQFDNVAGRRRLSRSAAITAAAREWVRSHRGDPVAPVPLPPEKEKPDVDPDRPVRDPFENYADRQPNPNNPPS